MPLDPEDLDIVCLARAGERAEALSRFYARHGDRLAAACRRLAGGEVDGEDTLQETLIQVDRALASFRGEAALYSWAFRIAVHVSLNRRRGLAARASHVDLEAASAALVAGPAAGGDPDSSCLASFRAWVVERALLDLPEGQRLALTLHDLEELGAVETAQLLGIAPNAVKQRVHRARKGLRERIARELASRGIAADEVGVEGCVSGLFAPPAPAVVGLST